MAHNKFTATRIDRRALVKLRMIAEADNRTIPTTLSLLIDAEIERRLSGNVVRVDKLPHPEDAKTDPVLYTDYQ